MKYAILRVYFSEAAKRTSYGVSSTANANANANAYCLFLLRSTS